MKKVFCNWENLESIKKAEKEKSILENKGYRLVKTESLLNGCVLFYEK